MIELAVVYAVFSLIGLCAIEDWSVAKKKPIGTFLFCILAMAFWPVFLFAED